MERAIAWFDAAFIFAAVAVMLLIHLDTSGTWTAPGWLLWPLVLLVTAGMVLFVLVVLGGLLLGRWSDRPATVRRTGEEA